MKIDVDAIRLELDDNRKAKSAISTALLTVIVNASEFGECPWCEVAIGAYSHHWMTNCPFKGLNEILEGMR